MKHLMKIGEIYYYRRRVSRYLQVLHEKAFVKLSLHTSNKEHAKLRAFKLDNMLEELSFELRLKLIEPKQAIEQLKLAGLIGTKAQLTTTRTGKKLVVEVKKNRATELVSTLFQQYKQDRLAAGRWIDKTALENQRCFDLLLTAVGDHPPEYYTHQSLMDFRAVLQKLPPNVNTRPHTKGKSLSVVLKMQHTKLLSLSQVNKYLVCISAFFSWLAQHEIIAANPAHHLLISRAKKSPDEERLAYSSDEV